jgi:hypothetical protein
MLKGHSWVSLFGHVEVVHLVLLELGRKRATTANVKHVGRLIAPAGS